MDYFLHSPTEIQETLINFLGVIISIIALLIGVLVAIFQNRKAHESNISLQKEQIKNEYKRAINAIIAESELESNKWQLPPLAITTDNPILQNCITYLNQCPDMPFHDIIEVVKAIVT